MNRFLFFSFLLMLVGCSNETTNTEMPEPGNEFDRAIMLSNWADNIIIPGFESFVQQTTTLKTAVDSFSASPTMTELNKLRTVWLDAYNEWQKVSMFELGRAEEIRLRDNLNIYPTNTEEILANIFNDNGYNLELPSQRDRQGFPAMDYMLYGLADTDEAILALYTTDENAARYRQYLTDLSVRIDDLSKEVLNDWQTGFRDEFISNDGNSSTASVDRMVNDYIFYYEKALRAGKVGIPAGVFSGSPLKTHVEAPYKANVSRQLLLTAIDAVQNFFNGRHFGSAQEGESLKSYLDYLNTMKNGADLSQLINEQFNAARQQAQTLNEDFASQIESDNTAMLATFDQLQKNVVLIKVDMLQAMNINVDFVDADGD